MFQVNLQKKDANLDTWDGVVHVIPVAWDVPCPVSSIMTMTGKCGPWNHKRTLPNHLDQCTKCMKGDNVKAHGGLTFDQLTPAIYLTLIQHMEVLFSDTSISLQYSLLKSVSDGFLRLLLTATSFNHYCSANLFNLKDLITRIYWYLHNYSPHVTLLISFIKH